MYTTGLVIYDNILKEILERNAMSKKSKARRDAKKKKLKNKNHNVDKNFSPTQVKSDGGPVLTSIENPLSSLTREQQESLIEKISSESKVKLKEGIDDLKEFLCEYCPLTTLSIVSTYSLSQGVSDDGVVNKESPIGVEQFHVELLQALILTIPKDSLGTKMPTNRDIEVVFELIKEIQQNSSLSRYRTAELNQSNEEKAISTIQELLRAHTQIVRNWGFNSQIKTIITELYTYFDFEVNNIFGFTVTDTIKVFSHLVSSGEQKLTERYEFLSSLYRTHDKKKLIDLYTDHIGLSVNDKEELFEDLAIDRTPFKQLFFLMLSHYDLFTPYMYHIDCEELSQELSIAQETIVKILNHFSLESGELATHNQDFIFLDNPIWTRPIFQRESEYFCPLPQVFFSFSLNSLDNLIEGYDKDKLHERRALYLEEKIEEIVKTRFPESHTISGIQWDFEGKTFETDLITFIDSHALIIEAKSHNITKPALRGAPDRIKKHFKEIYIDPSIQSFRFAEKIKELIENPDTNDPLIDKLPIDISKINKVIRVSVSLEDFATLQTNLKLFEDTGWLPDGYESCPSTNLADFETIFDLLEHPVQILHYLERRSIIQRQYNLMGDELDYLGLYLSTFLALGNFSDYATDHVIDISGMSDSIDSYYQAKDAGVSIQKPKPKTSKLFTEIFNQLEKRSTPRWTEIGCILNMYVPEDQVQLSNMIKILSKRVHHTWQQVGHKNMIILCPHESSEYSLAVVLYKDANKQLRDKFINEASVQALEPDHVKQCLLIAKNIDDNEIAYHLIGLFESR